VIYEAWLETLPMLPMDSSPCMSQTAVAELTERRRDGLCSSPQLLQRVLVHYSTDSTISLDGEQHRERNSPSIVGNGLEGMIALMLVNILWRAFGGSRGG
jgi:hypothetical protein